MYSVATNTSVTSECNRDPHVLAMPEYQEWIQMIERCYNEDHPFFPHYGAVGVTVADNWLHSFSAFLADVKAMPKDGNSYFLKRIDPRKPYQSNNCSWRKLQIQELHFAHYDNAFMINKEKSKQYNTFMPEQEKVNYQYTVSSPSDSALVRYCPCCAIL